LKKISIAMVCEDLSPEMGGQAISIPLLGEHLEEIGVTVRYFSGIHYRNQSSAQNYGRHFYFRYFHKRLKWSFGLFFQLWQCRNDIDIVHINNLWNFVPITAYFFAKIVGIPYVVSTRGMLIAEFVDKSRLKKILLRLIFKRILQEASFLHVTSEGEVESIEAYKLSSTIVKIGHGVKKIIPEPDFFVFNELRAKKRYILFSGRVCRYKNVGKLIKAFSIFSKSEPHWSLYIVGEIEDEEYFSELIKIIDSKNMSKKVNFFGHKKQSELASFYTGASIFANVSNSENFGLSIGEALSYGIPCIVPENSPWGDVEISNVGQRVSPDVPIISQSLKKISSNLLDDENVFHKAILSVDNLSWESQANKIYQFYVSILSGK
tara:strand:- start:4097 stop:5227 length:1131 start_codon:yes stop_codon:yes gene_type:complete